MRGKWLQVCVMLICCAIGVNTCAQDKKQSPDKASTARALDLKPPKPPTPGSPISAGTSARTLRHGFVETNDFPSRNGGGHQANWASAFEKTAPLAWQIRFDPNNSDAADVLSKSESDNKTNKTAMAAVFVQAADMRSQHSANGYHHAKEILGDSRERRDFELNFVLAKEREGKELVPVIMPELDSRWTPRLQETFKDRTGISSFARGNSLMGDNYFVESSYPKEFESFLKSGLRGPSGPGGPGGGQGGAAPNPYINQDVYSADLGVRADGYYLGGVSGSENLLPIAISYYRMALERWQASQSESRNTANQTLSSYNQRICKYNQALCHLNIARAELAIKSPSNTQDPAAELKTAIALFQEAGYPEHEALARGLYGDYLWSKNDKGQAAQYWPK